MKIKIKFDPESFFLDKVLKEIKEIRKERKKKDKPEKVFKE